MKSTILELTHEGQSACATWLVALIRKDSNMYYTVTFYITQVTSPHGPDREERTRYRKPFPTAGPKTPLSP